MKGGLIQGLTGACPYQAKWYGKSRSLAGVNVRQRDILGGYLYSTIGLVDAVQACMAQAEWQRLLGFGQQTWSLRLPSSDQWWSAMWLAQFTEQ